MTESEPIPQAEMRPVRSRDGVPALAWIVPVVALALAGILVALAMRDRGVIITVRFDDGHGIEVGDPVRHRGIELGVVDSIRLADDLRGVEISARLQRDGERIARSGTRFWIVRPELGISGVRGVETLVGPRYLALEPGPADAPVRRSFVGLSDAPVVLEEHPGDLEIVVVGIKQGSLRPGAPLRYRDVRIGVIRSAGLASDGRGIEARVHVEREYRDVVRAGSRFWDSGGVRASVGLAGGTLEIDSLENLLTGGLSVATPPLEEAGDAVRTGHRFRIAERADPRWQAWAPALAIGSDLLPAGATLPQPRRATLAWREGLVLRSDHARSGWLLPTTAGVLGPGNLLRIDEDAREDTTSLEVAGTSVTLGSAVAWEGGGLLLRDIAIDGTEPWPWSRRRRPDAAEDVILIGDPAAPPLPLGTDALAQVEGSWSIDEGVSISAEWHGAAVIAREDGVLVGIVLVDDEGARVALVPAP